MILALYLRTKSQEAIITNAKAIFRYCALKRQQHPKPGKGTPVSGVYEISEALPLGTKYGNKVSTVKPT
jgi:hypothetical protein